MKGKRLISIGAVLVMGWIGFLLLLAQREETICVGSLSVASRQAIIRQGVWSHLQNTDVASLPPGLPPRSYAWNPTIPISLPAVQEFESTHPNCCEVVIPGEKHLITLLWGRLFHPSRAIVFVRPSPKAQTIFNTNYEVDACWENVRKSS
jgi:hypothetical protein